MADNSNQIANNALAPGGRPATTWRRNSTAFPTRSCPTSTPPLTAVRSPFGGMRIARMIQPGTVYPHGFPRGYQRGLMAAATDNIVQRSCDYGGPAKAQGGPRHRSPTAPVGAQRMLLPGAPASDEIDIAPVAFPPVGIVKLPEAAREKEVPSKKYCCRVSEPPQ